MARYRRIKPSFWEDEKIATLSYPARLLFIGLWNFSDDEGRCRAAGPYLHGHIFPYDDKLDVPKLLKELNEAGFIQTYRVNGQRYLWVPNFLKHQKIDRPQASEIPEPPIDSTNDSQNDSPNGSRLSKVKLREEKRREVKSGAHAKSTTHANSPTGAVNSSSSQGKKDQKKIMEYVKQSKKCERICGPASSLKGKHKAGCPFQGPQA